MLRSHINEESSRVYAPDVTIRNVKITLTSIDMWAIRVVDAGSANISYTEVGGRDKSQGSVQYAILSQTNSRIVIDRVNLHHCADCVQGERIDMSNSYIHDLANPPGAHVDGFQCNSVCEVSLVHNTIMNEWPQTSAIALFGDFGTPVNSIVDRNLLAGGGYTVYGGTKASTGIKFTNNRFSTIYYPDCGSFGAATGFYGGSTKNEWSGNVIDSTGASLAG